MFSTSLRRFVAPALALVAAASLPLVASTPATAATAKVTPTTTTVRAGEALGYKVTGCPYRETEDGSTYTYTSARVVLVHGTGAAERLAGLGISDDTTGRMDTPGWLDPSVPTVIGGACERITYDDDRYVGTEVIATFPDVPITVTAAAAGASSPRFTLSRSTVASGQALTVNGSGCASGEFAQASAFAGTDLSGRTLDDPAFSDYAEVAANGTFAVRLGTAGSTTVFSGEGDWPAATPGPYVVVVLCLGFVDDGENVYVHVAAPAPITVSGTTATDDIHVTNDPTGLQIAGGGCTPPGTTVTVRIDGNTYDSGYEDAHAAPTALSRLVGPKMARAITRDSDDGGDGSDSGNVHEVLTAVSGADGSWSLDWPLTSSGYQLVVAAECGDALADGFAYRQIQVFEDPFADIWIDRTSPTSAPTGSEVVVHGYAGCTDDPTFVLSDADGSTVVTKAVDVDPEMSTWRTTFTAPTTPGAYLVGANCGAKSGDRNGFEVFTPTTLANTAPLPAEPTTGWPSESTRQTYHGKLGPIVLQPDMGDGSDDGTDDGGMPMDLADQIAAAAASGKTVSPTGKLDSTEFFIDVPRPAGALAITGMTFDLVDASGAPVSQHLAHLHHFVIGTGTRDNPACPDGTFGVPGEIVAAAGAERTALEFPDPYGIVVQKDDDWTGIYEVMNRSEKQQEVYLTYDVTYRTDVKNVRPLAYYFGSASGCDSFTWDIDGSGSPDVQSHYVTMRKDGVLVGAGGHIHNGGTSLDVTDDRNRRLCRSELELGTMPIGHGTMDDGSGMAPEFYDDDLEIEGITNCRLREQVRAGERIRIDTTYANDRPRSAVMGIYALYVWEGAGPKTPVTHRDAEGATPIRTRPRYAG